jgi:hypothetical protein
LRVPTPDIIRRWPCGGEFKDSSLLSLEYQMRLVALRSEQIKWGLFGGLLILSILKGLNLSAQGREARATLGKKKEKFTTLKGLNLECLSVSYSTLSGLRNLNAMTQDRPSCLGPTLG